MFSLSSRARKKLTKKVNRKLPESGPQAFDVVRGTVRGTWTTKVVVVLAVSGAVFVVAAAFGYLLYPGILWFIYLWRQYKPPRLIAVTPGGLVSFPQSFFNNGPTKMLGSGPLAPIPASETGGAVIVGTETITLKPEEYSHLVSLATQPPVSPPVNMSPPVGISADSLGV